MEPELLKQLLDELKSGRRSVESAMEQLAQVPYADMGFAKVDHHRKLRCGFSEVIFGEGKNTEDTVATCTPDGDPRRRRPCNAREFRPGRRPSRGLSRSAP